MADWFDKYEDMGCGFYMDRKTDVLSKGSDDFIEELKKRIVEDTVKKIVANAESNAVYISSDPSSSLSYSSPKTREDGATEYTWSMPMTPEITTGLHNKEEIMAKTTADNSLQQRAKDFNNFIAGSGVQTRFTLSGPTKLLTFGTLFEGGVGDTLDNRHVFFEGGEYVELIHAWAKYPDEIFYRFSESGDRYFDLKEDEATALISGFSDILTLYAGTIEQAKKKRAEKRRKEKEKKEKMEIETIARSAVMDMNGFGAWS